MQVEVHNMLSEKFNKNRRFFAGCRMTMLIFGTRSFLTLKPQGIILNTLSN